MMFNQGTKNAEHIVDIRSVIIRIIPEPTDLFMTHQIVLKNPHHTMKIL